MSKTEKQKMLSGELYLAFDSILVAERQQAKECLFEFNNLRPSEIEKRNEIVRGLLNSIGEGFVIETPFRCDYGYNIEIGKNFYANYNLVILDCAKVVIGDNVLIGPNVSIFTAGHPLEVSLRAKGLEHARPVALGHNVWIGGNVVINPGVSIGSNSVIGSGSVVTKNIPDNVLAVGNPCRVLRALPVVDFKNL